MTFIEAELALKAKITAKGGLVYEADPLSEEQLAVAPTIPPEELAKLPEPMLRRVDQSGG